MPLFSSRIPKYVIFQALTSVATVGQGLSNSVWYIQHFLSPLAEGSLLYTIYLLFFITKHLVDMRPVFKDELFRCGPLEKTERYIFSTLTLKPEGLGKGGGVLSPDFS